MPMKPSAPISLMSSAGTFLFSSMSAARGSTFSRAKSRAVFCTSACSSVSDRSKPASLPAGPVPAVSVLVVMVALRRVYADDATVWIAREEIVAVRIPYGPAGLTRGLERAIHVRHAEPHHEPALRAHLRRRVPVLA